MKSKIQTMKRMGMSETFIGWVKFLFGNARETINLMEAWGNNSKFIEELANCLLALYLFLIIGEALTHIIKKVVVEGKIRGITLFGGGK